MTRVVEDFLSSWRRRSKPTTKDELAELCASAAMAADARSTELAEFLQWVDRLQTLRDQNRAALVHGLPPAVTPNVAPSAGPSSMAEWPLLRALKEVRCEVATHGIDLSPPLDPPPLDAAHDRFVSCFRRASLGLRSVSVDLRPERLLTVGQIRGRCAKPQPSESHLRKKVLEGQPFQKAGGVKRYDWDRVAKPSLLRFGIEPLPD